MFYSRLLTRVIAGVIFTGFASVVSVSHASADEQWEIMPGRTSIGFRVRHFLLMSVDGRFKRVSGSVSTPSGDDFSHVAIDVSIPVNSVFTGNEDRDAHLKTADFFDADSYPDMRFKSTRVTQRSSTHFELDGMLSIRGITKPVHLEVEKLREKALSNGNSRIDFSATGKLNRYDFGLRWNKLTETGGMVVGEDVEIQLDVSLQKPSGRSHNQELASSAGSRAATIR